MHGFRNSILSARTPALAAFAALAALGAAATVPAVGAVLATSPTTPTAKIAKLDPSQVFTIGNDLVFVEGTGLSTVTGVTVDGKVVDFADEGDGTLSFFTPVHAIGKAQVRLVTAGGTTADNGTLDDLTYITPPPVPVITSVSPTYGPVAGGNTVTVKGKNLLGALGVVFGDFALADNLVVKSDSELTVKAPPAAAARKVDLLIINAGGSNENTAADDYTYGAAPTTPVPTTPLPIITYGAVAQNPSTGGAGSKLSIRFSVATDATVTATVSQVRLGIVNSSGVCVLALAGVTVSATNQCSKRLYIGDSPSAKFVKGAGELIFPTAPVYGTYTITLTSKSASGGTDLKMQTIAVK